MLRDLVAALRDLVPGVDTACDDSGAIGNALSTEESVAAVWRDRTPPRELITAAAAADATAMLLLHQFSQISTSHKQWLWSDAAMLVLAEAVAADRNSAAADLLVSLASRGIPPQAFLRLYRQTLSSPSLLPVLQRVLLVASPPSLAVTPFTTKRFSVVFPKTVCLHLWVLFTGDATLFRFESAGTALTVSVSSNNLTANGEAVSDMYLPPRTFHHVVLVLEGSRLSGWINGESITRKRVSGLAAGSGTLALGDSLLVEVEYAHTILFSHPPVSSLVLCGWLAGPAFRGSFQNNIMGFLTPEVVHRMECLSGKLPDHQVLQGVFLRVPAPAPVSAHDALYTVGGGALLLLLVEAATTTDTLHTALDAFFAGLTDWRLSREATVFGGFEILATLLRAKAALLTHETLDRVLAHCGFVPDSPADLVVVNPVAYKLLVMDFDVWAPAGQPFRFLLYQFTVFGQALKHAGFNVRQLVRLKTIRRFVQALKARRFDEATLPIVASSLGILVRANPSTEVLHALSAYVVYALAHNDPGAVWVVRAIALLASDTPGLRAHRQLCRGVSVRWCLVVLSMGGPEVVAEVVGIITAVLAPQDTFTRFVQHKYDTALWVLVGKGVLERAVAGLLGAAWGVSGDTLSEVLLGVRPVVRVEMWIGSAWTLAHARDAALTERYMGCVDALFDTHPQWQRLCCDPRWMEAVAATEHPAASRLLAKIVIDRLFGGRGFKEFVSALGPVTARAAFPAVVDHVGQFVAVSPESLDVQGTLRLCAVVVALMAAWGHTVPADISALVLETLRGVYDNRGHPAVMQVLAQAVVDATVSEDVLKQVLYLQGVVLPEMETTQVVKVLWHLLGSPPLTLLAPVFRAVIMMRPEAVEKARSPELSRFVELFADTGDEEVWGQLEGFPGLCPTPRTPRGTVEVVAEVLQLQVDSLPPTTPWIDSTVASETRLYHRHLQDHLDNVRYFITAFNRLKLESARLVGSLGSASFTVDLIEGPERMRGRTVPASAVTEKLAYTVDVPGGVADSSPDPDALDDMDYLFVELDSNRRILRALAPGDRIAAIFNVAQVRGLTAVEGLLIVGMTHVYIMEHYFHTTTGDVVDVEDAPPGERDRYAMHLASPRDETPGATHTWRLQDLAHVSKRRFLLRDVAVEVMFAGGSSIFVTCGGVGERDRVHARLEQLANQGLVDRDLREALVGAQSATLTKRLWLHFSLTLPEATKRWQRGELSNFYYLVLVNTLAGRTPNDLTQYPVFPWVLRDYTSSELDLGNPAVYRDLSRPMGGQSEKRAGMFRERYEALVGMDQQPFHYGTHYSSSLTITSFLIRCEPYVQLYLLLQGGRFDHADRLFNSVGKAWSSAAVDNTLDVRELIPEFFHLAEFLVNDNHYDLGTGQDGTVAGDVVLPPWAGGDPLVFIARHREALESDYVSANLHHWIDLVFGYKQQGEAAVAAMNVFQSASYVGSVDLDSLADETEWKAVVGVIHNFGQTPRQVFTSGHPRREVGARAVRHGLQGPQSVLVEKSPVARLVWKGGRWRGRPSGSLTVSGLKVKVVDGNSLSVGLKTFEQLHSGRIVVVRSTGEDTFVSGSTDGSVHCWRVHPEPVDLELVGVLRGHVHGVRDIQVAPSFGACVSVDEVGRVLVWDLRRCQFVRELGKGEVVGVSEVNGWMGVYGGGRMVVYTMNGREVWEGEVGEGVTCMAWVKGKEGGGWCDGRVVVLGGKEVVMVRVVVRGGEWQVEMERGGVDGEVRVVEVGVKVEGREEWAEVVLGMEDGRVVTWG